MWSKSFYRMFYFVEHSYSLCICRLLTLNPLSCPPMPFDCIDCRMWKRSIHSYFVSIYIFIYKSFMFDGFLASSSASCCRAVSLSSALSCLSHSLSLSGFDLLFSSSIRCVAFQTYFIMPSTFVLSLAVNRPKPTACVKNVTHVVIDFTCERNEFQFAWYFLFHFSERNTANEKKWNERSVAIWKRWGRYWELLVMLLGVPLKCDTS